MCDATHNKPFGLVLTAVNKVRRHIVFILDNITVLLYQWSYNILCLILSFWFPPGF